RRAGRVQPRRLCRGVRTREEVRERQVDIVLRGLVVKANTVIQSEPAVHAPVVLKIELAVPVKDVERGASRGLRIALNPAEIRIGVAVARIEQRVVRVRLKVETARKRRAIRL